MDHYAPITRQRFLPPCLNGGPDALSLGAKQKIAQWSRPNARRFLFETAKSWLIIAVAIAVAIKADSVLVTALAILVVAGQQLKFGLLLHEQAHYLGLKSRWGDLIADVLVCYPLIFVSVKNYARVHLAHHKNYFVSGDPDLVRKSGADWNFPMGRWRLLRLFLKDLLGLNLIQTVIGKNVREGTVEIKRRGPDYPWLRIVYLASWAAIFTVTQSWSIFFLYWLLPLVTILQAFIRLGAICEHVYIANAPLETSTAIILPTWWESLIFPHLNFFYHVYHHYFPNVPFSRLPDVHALFQGEGLVREECVFTSILSYCQFINKPIAQDASPAAADTAQAASF
jgi:fatty acid desaturase